MFALTWPCLNVLAIKKLAVAKGCTAERTATIWYRHFVRVTGADVP